MLTLHRELLQLRRAVPALACGSYAPVATDGELLAYIRDRDGSRCLMALNLSPEPLAMVLQGSGLEGRILLSTHLDREGETATDMLNLRPDEGVVIQLLR
jgi:alpha-glucosidase